MPVRNQGVNLNTVSAAKIAAALSGAVKVSLCVENQTCTRIRPVRPSEAVEYDLLAFATHLEHHSIARSTAVLGGAIEVSLRVQNQTCSRILPARPIEAVKVDFSLSDLVTARLFIVCPAS
jgi:hypothetical protein